AEHVRQIRKQEEDRKRRELDEQRQQQALLERQKKQQLENSEVLKKRLFELRSRRDELEKLREESIRRLRSVHNRISLRRKEEFLYYLLARAMWKKRYFNEKKKMPPLEGRIHHLQTDLSQTQNKTIINMDQESKHAAQTGFLKEAEIGSIHVERAKIQHDIQDVRYLVDQAKLRLTTDIKLRNQAENECRSLRHELNQAKMNLNHIKHKVMVR
ncbi:unnamed protein product, partial [Didymodactylos carnosus]